MAQTAKKWTLAKPFEGVPKVTDFKLEEEAVSFDLKPGEILLEAVYLTVDPYMREESAAWINIDWTADSQDATMKLVSATIMSRLDYCNSTLIGIPGDQIVRLQRVQNSAARVKISNNQSYPEGSLVVATVGWRTLTHVAEPESMTPLGPTAALLPDFGERPASLGLGCLGMPGMTAYFGLLDRGKPKAGETVLVSGAAGAVGSVVGQIAKIKGCTVIGSAGTKSKCDWLKELGFDHVFNYKESSVDDALKEFAPKGIDLYFDNVGGDFTYTVLEKHINFAGRVVVCGAISQYNDEKRTEKSTYGFVIYKQLDILGIIVSTYKDRFAEGISQMLEWIKKGKIKYQETVTQGFDNMPKAFIELFSGGNTGKAVVKV